MKILSLNDGFIIEKPSLTIPWGLSKSQLTRLLESHGLQTITPDYYVLSCTSLSGLAHHLGFHFDRDCGTSKYWLELFRPNRAVIKESYAESQRHLEETFGPPTMIQAGEEGFPYHQWQAGLYRVTHKVYERFGLSESITIWPICTVAALP